MIIAITGGIGSGKSTVTKILESFGAITISADEINREIMKEPAYIQKIGENFKGVIKDGEIDKHTLSKKIFTDAKAMQKLNSIAHPEIKKEINRRLDELDCQDKAVFIEVPLLVESNMEDMFDKIWLIRASKSLRLKRITKRDLMSEEYVKKIIASQANDKIRVEYATDIIENNGDTEDLYNLVKVAYQSLYE